MGWHLLVCCCVPASIRRSLIPQDALDCHSIGLDVFGGDPQALAIAIRVLLLHPLVRTFLLRWLHWDLYFTLDHFVREKVITTSCLDLGVVHIWPFLIT